MNKTFTLFHILSDPTYNITDAELAQLIDHEIKDITCEPDNRVIHFIEQYSRSSELLKTRQIGKFCIIQN